MGGDLIECIGSVNFLARIEGINSNGISGTQGRVREDGFVSRDGELQKLRPDEIRSSLT